MGEHPDEVRLAEQINNSLDSVLSLEIDYFGFIFEKSTVRKSVKKGTTLILHYQESMVAESIKQIVERIVKFWDSPVDNSDQRLLTRTWKVYESRE